MRLPAIPFEFMRVLVVVIVGMQVLMIQSLMFVHVFMVLAYVQPDAQCHKGSRDPEA